MLLSLPYSHLFQDCHHRRELSNFRNVPTAVHGVAMLLISTAFLKFLSEDEKRVGLVGRFQFMHQPVAQRTQYKGIYLKTYY